ncbi:MAG: hypothetical protein LBD80_04905 [Tannerella sp.]|nr:hypothetical protein [Tannerella sp.]
MSSLRDEVFVHKGGHVKVRSCVARQGIHVNRTGRLPMRMLSVRIFIFFMNPRWGTGRREGVN